MSEAATSTPASSAPASPGAVDWKALQAANRQYGRFVMTRGLGIFFRNLWLFLLLSLAMATIQSVIMWLASIPGSRINWIVATVLSAAWTVVISTFFVRLALAENAERLALGDVISDGLSRMPVFAGWLVVQGTAIWAGVVLGFWPAIVVGFLLAYAPFLVTDGENANPFGKSIRAVGQRFWRLALTVAVQLLVFAFLSFGLSMTQVALPIPLAQFINLTVLWLILGWFLTSLGVLYRSTAVGISAGASRRPITDPDASGARSEGSGSS